MAMLQSFVPAGVRMFAFGWRCYKALTPLESGCLLLDGDVTKLCPRWGRDACFWMAMLQSFDPAGVMMFAFVWRCYKALTLQGS